MVAANLLRPITQRLNSTLIPELPRHASFFATAILNCAELLQTSDGQKDDASIQVHKLTTRITALLHDKTLEGRFTGLVLVKALIEAGGSQCLHTLASSWIKGLLSCLNKHDPPEVKRLSVYALTRIFLLSRDHQVIVRETVAPNLPAFINATLSSIKPAKSSGSDREIQSPSCLLFSVLQCWSRLIVAFPSTLRPFVPTIRGILLNLLGEQDSPTQITEIALRVLAVLHCCAPKDTASSEWFQLFQRSVKAAHQAADLLFRSIIEDWKTNGTYQPSAKAGKKVSSHVKTSTSDEVGLARWTGFRSGVSRLLMLIDLIRYLVENSQGQAVKVSLAELLDLTARLSAVVQPSKEYALHENKEISRDEREELYMFLPQIHHGVIGLHSQLALTCRRFLLPVCRPVVTQIGDIFESNLSHDVVRAAVYDVIAHFLKQSAIHLLPMDADRVAAIAHSCCLDLRSLNEGSTQKSDQMQLMPSSARSLETRRSQSKVYRSENLNSQSPLYIAAWNLLPIILAHVPAGLLSAKARAEIDRSAILVGHQEAMLSSVMSPHKPQGGARTVPGILPFWARTRGTDLAREAVMRPRQPCIVQDIKQDFSNKEEEEEAETLPLVDDIVEAPIEQPAIATRPDDTMAAPSEQLSEELLSHATANEQMMRKREHEAVETEPADGGADSPKKARFDDQPVEQIGRLAEHVEKEQVAVLHRSESLAPSTEPVSIVLDARHESRANPVAETAPRHDRLRQASDQDDDSDDSDIPQIDTALSSEDEDDDMEE